MSTANTLSVLLMLLFPFFFQPKASNSNNIRSPVSKRGFVRVARIRRCESSVPTNAQHSHC